MIDNTDREISDGKKFYSEKMLRSSVTPKTSTVTIISLTERETVNNPTKKSRTMKLGSERSENEKSVSKNLFSKISDRKTLQNENLSTKIPTVNISKKKKSTAKSLTARNLMKKF